MIQTDQVAITDLEKLNTNQQFGTWVVDKTLKAPRQDAKLEEIDLLVAGLISSKVVANKDEALQYLNDLAGSFTNKSGIMGADIAGIKYSDRILKLRRLIEREDRPNTELLFRLFGSLTHQFAWQIDAGLVPSAYTADNVNQYLRYIQPTLFESANSKPQLFPSPEESGSLNVFRDNGHVNALKSSWSEVQPMLREPLDWQTKLNKIRLYVHEIEKLLEPLLGYHMKTLLKYRKIDHQKSEYLAAITLVTWASILIHGLETKDLCIFPELPVIHKDHGLGYRRVDGLWIKSIGGKKPSKKQKETLNRILSAVLKGQFKVGSLGEFTRLLREIFKAPIEAQIRDYKIAVGDVLGCSDYLPPKEMFPVKSHQTQLEVYLLLSTLDKYLLNGGNGDDDPWVDNGEGVIQAELSYMLPTELPFLSPIVRGMNDQESSFIKEIIMKFPMAKKTGFMRGLSNLFAKHTLGLLNEDNQSGKTISLPKSVSKAPLLFHLNEFATPIEKIIERSKQYIDEYKIIELVMLSGQPSYLLYLEQLSKQIKKGVLKTFQYSSEFGGFVDCPDTSHSALNPYMYVDIKEGTFQCITCGNFGVIDSTIFDTFQHVSLNDIKRRNRHTKKIVLKPKVHDLLSNAQELFCEGFRFNKVAKQFFSDQNLDHGTALDLGVGYGSTYVVEHLLEGYSFKELVDVGLIDFQINPDPAAELYELLLAIGYHDKEIVKTMENDKQVTSGSFGKPYFTLANQITFPLMISGCVTNFHGQSVKTGKHRRLSVKGGHRLYGSFNSAAFNDDSDEVYLTEYPVDALALMAMGYNSVIAIEKATNFICLEALTRSEKRKAYLAFPNNKKGVKSTERILTWFSENGTESKLSIGDLTSTVFASRFKSANFDCESYIKWWRRVGSQDFSELYHIL